MTPALAPAQVHAYSENRLLMINYNIFFPQIVCLCAHILYNMKVADGNSTNTTFPAVFQKAVRR